MTNVAFLSTALWSIEHACTLIPRAFDRLESECVALGRAALFSRLSERIGKSETERAYTSLPSARAETMGKDSAPPICVTTDLIDMEEKEGTRGAGERNSVIAPAFHEIKFI